VTQPRFVALAGASGYKGRGRVVRAAQRIEFPMIHTDPAKTVAADGAASPQWQAGYANG
jgi:hypothetical protein